MSAPSPLSRTAVLRHVAETLTVATAGGLALGLIGFPAGWLSGAIIAVAAFALAGRPMQIPMPLMRTIYVFIGISLGAVVTPETLHGMATYPLSIAVLMLAMACVSFVGAGYLRLVHGWDKTSAYLAAAPGGLAQVLVLTVEYGANLRGIAIVQTIRIVIVAVGLPAGLSLFGLVGQGGTRSVGGPFDPAMIGELGILVAVSTVGAFLAQRFRFPGGLLFGAMLTSAALHGSGLIHALVPWWVANTAMIALGAVTGSRFANTPLRMLVHYLGAAAGSFAVVVAITALFAIGLIEVLSLHIAEVMIAFAPGAVDAMMLLALGLHLDPVYVGAHHVMRIFFVSLTLPFVVRRVARPDTPAEVVDKPSFRPPPFQD